MDRSPCDSDIPPSLYPYLAVSTFSLHLTKGRTAGRRNKAEWISWIGYDRGIIGYANGSRRSSSPPKKMGNPDVLWLPWRKRSAEERRRNRYVLKVIIGLQGKRIFFTGMSLLLLKLKTQISVRPRCSLSRREADLLTDSLPAQTQRKVSIIFSLLDSSFSVCSNETVYLYSWKNVF